jgi:hypothetical protein
MFFWVLVGWRKRRRLMAWNQVCSLDFFLKAICIIPDSCLSPIYLFLELLLHLHRLRWRLILALILACWPLRFIYFIFGGGEGGAVSFGFFSSASRAWDLGDQCYGRSTALKSAFPWCESIDGRDSSHSCAIFMLTSSEKVFLRACLPA